MVAINAGATSSANYAGVNYEADKYSRGGEANSTEDSIDGADGSALFNTERWGSYAYEIPVLDGTYSIEMHFVEMYHDGSGLRSFNVSVENNQIESNLDLFSVAGHDSGYSVVASDIRVTDGTLDITLEGVTDNGTLSGFAVYSANGGIDTSVPVSNCSGYVGLTYDDGPTGDTQAFVQRLKDNNLTPVTFFVNGSRNINSSVAAAMMSAGAIQSHAFDHVNLGNSSYQQVADQLNRNNNAITGAGAPAPTVFRPPYGDDSQTIRQAASDLGMRFITWDVDSSDWNGASSQSVIDAVGRAGNGDTILMHDNPTWSSTQAGTLQGIARVLEQKGYCPGRIDPNTGRAVAP